MPASPQASRAALCKLCSTVVRYVEPQCPALTFVGVQQSRSEVFRPPGTVDFAAPNLEVIDTLCFQLHDAPRL